jgi:N-acetyl-1-D-myo-inositol-2-amino-2-deoxy-alpha-D-glucopyranoside deacetylase
MAAARRAADPAAPAALGTPWATAKVYACVVPRSALREAGGLLARSVVDGPNPFARLAELGDGALADLPFGVPDDLVTARIDARRWLPAKVAAMRAHRSQMHQNGWFFVLAENSVGFGFEHYQLLAGTAHPDHDGELEDDLFAGIRASA